MSLDIEAIVDSQVHIGTLKSEAHPKTKQYRLDIVGNVIVFNPEIILERLNVVKKKIQLAKKDGKDILFVCEKKMYADDLEKLATKCGVHYLNYKVPSGFITNFDTFKQRVVSMNKMEKFMESESFFSMTKKEQLVYKRNFVRVQRIYKGIQDLKKVPDIVVVVDGQMMKSFVSELKKSNVNSVIISSSDFSRWWNIDDFVPANVLSYKSVDFVIKYLLS